MTEIMGKENMQIFEKEWTMKVTDAKITHSITKTHIIYDMIGYGIRLIKLLKQFNEIPYSDKSLAPNADHTKVPKSTSEWG